MESNTENPSMGNFSIQDTMDMGAGDSQLLNDLMEPETSTSNPDDVQEIIAEVEPAKPAVSDKAPAGKEITQKIDGEKPNPSSAITDFLGSGEEDDEEDEEDLPITPKKNISDIKKGDEDEDDADDKNVQSSTQFSALANDLTKLGVFTSNEDGDDEPISTAEEFLERFNVEKQKGAMEVVNNFIGQFGEDYQQAFDAIFVKGADPKEYFDTFNNISNFSELDLSQENNQVKVLKQALTDQGFDPEDVETEIERLRNYGDLESVSAKHHKVLVKKEAAKLRQVEAEATQKLQQKQQIKNQYVSNVQEIIQDKLKTRGFDGIPLNPKMANELQDFLLVDKYKTTSGETLTDFDRTILEMKRPENHEMKVKVGLLLKMLEKDPTLSTIQKTGATKQTNQLFGELAKQVTTDKTYKSSKAKPTSWFK